MIYHLDKDPCVKVVQPRLQLKGYEIYLVEQWACSRRHHSSTITTYTGHSSDKIFVGLLSIGRDESQWGQELAEYFEFVRSYGRGKQTPLGTLMVTNLSNLSSDLTVIAVSDGDVRAHKEDFIVNEDLKRMGCSGRIALTLTAPTDAAKAKFHQLFRTCERIDFYVSVIELVRLVQLALVMFQKLGKQYADGLLCDRTEGAIKRWWAEFGTDFYNSEPSDGILGPTTVAALLGMMIGARNRLSLCGAPVPKDAFDLPGLKLAIGQFQKQQKLRRTRRLDRETVDKLHRITIKAPSGGMVPKAIKSTVAEMSGKTYKVEMETCDLEKFIQHLSGERAKYLWYGKPIKSATGISAMSSVDGGPRRNSAPATIAQGAPARIRNGGQGKNLTLVTGPYDSKNDPNAAAAVESIVSPSSYPLSAPVYPVGNFGIHHNTSDGRDPLRKAMFKTMNNRMNDAKSGLGKIKDVASGMASGISGQVNRRNHRKQTNEASPLHDTIQVPAATEEKHALSLKNANASSSAPVLEMSKPCLSLLHTSEQDAARSDPATIHLQHRHTSSLVCDAYHTESPVSLVMKSPFHSDSLVASKSDFREGISPMTQGLDAEALYGEILARRADGSVTIEYVPGTVDPSVAGSAQAYEDALEKPGQSSDSRTPELNHEISLILNRSQSFSEVVRQRLKRHEEFYPRRMSFSAAEEAVFDWEPIGDSDDRDQGFGSCPKSMKCMVLKVEGEMGEWAAEKIREVKVNPI